MRKEPYFRGKYYKWLPIRFLLDRIIKNMVLKAVNLAEDFIKEEEKILDIGAGGGWISEELQKRKKTSNTLLDVINLNQTDLPLIIYNGKDIPLEDNSFDSALLICVLHHCQNPERVLQEARRVVKDKIIIVENVPSNRFSRFAMCCEDVFLNLGFCMLGNSFKEIINLPFNFKKISGWKNLFEEIGLKVIHEKKFNQSLNVQSVGFVVQKI